MRIKLLKTIEPDLDRIFENFYQLMLSNKDFSVFFKNDEQIRSLIVKQKKYFIQSLEQTEDELKITYTKLGEMHYDLKLPYVDFFASLGILEEGILIAITAHENNIELMRPAFKFFRIIRAHTAKGYLNRMLDKDSRDIDLYLENVKRSSELDTMFATERIIWLKNLIFAIKVENRAAAPILELPNSLYHSVQASTKKDPELMVYIREMVSRIEIDASNIFFFLEKKNYEEVLTLYRELMNIYKLSLMLTNVMTIAASSWIITSLTKDKLTGLLTRNSLDTIIEREFSLANASGYNISLIMVDLDHFKQINDTHGHAAGDEVLKGAAKILSENIRSTDFVFRIGGEEFLLVLKGATEKIAVRQAEVIRKEFEQRSYHFSGQRATVTASFGVSTYEGPFQKNFEAMLNQVDEKLYESKKNGRNRVTV